MKTSTPRRSDDLTNLRYRAAMPASSDPIYELKAQFFKSLSHPARIRILEVLADGPRSVSALQPEVGIEASHLSQQLGVLRRADIVDTERDGSSIIYSIGDDRILELLAVAKQILATTLSETSSMLADLDSMSFRSKTETRPKSGSKKK